MDDDDDIFNFQPLKRIRQCNSASPQPNLKTKPAVSIRSDWPETQSSASKQAPRQSNIGAHKRKRKQIISSAKESSSEMTHDTQKSSLIENRISPSGEDLVQAVCKSEMKVDDSLEPNCSSATEVSMQQNTTEMSLPFQIVCTQSNLDSLQPEKARAPEAAEDGEQTQQPEDECPEGDIQYLHRISPGQKARKQTSITNFFKSDRPEGAVKRKLDMDTNKQPRKSTPNKCSPSRIIRPCGVQFERVTGERQEDEETSRNSTDLLELEEVFKEDWNLSEENTTEAPLAKSAEQLPPNTTPTVDSKNNAFTRMMAQSKAQKSSAIEPKQQNVRSGRWNGFWAAKSQTDSEENSSEQSSATSAKGRRTCPYYKKIPDTPFAVDAFSYGSIAGVSAYFLSHFHSDHFGGLSRRFTGHVYCSEVTANLIKLKRMLYESLLHSLPMNEPRVIHGVEVVLLEAHHCPGAVMFLFRLMDGRVVLHTGDFRAKENMKQIPYLTSVSVDSLYLDTTYCEPSYDFPSQEDVVQFAVEVAMKHITRNKKCLIVCGTYTIGKENVFVAIAEALNLKICAERTKLSTLMCLQIDGLCQRLTFSWSEAQMHVLPMAGLRKDKLLDHLKVYASQYSELLAFAPTGWEYDGRSSASNLKAIQPKVWNNVTLYGIPYSEHSSFSELRSFVRFLKPGRIIPTVNTYGAKAQRQKQILDCWLTQ